MRSGVRADRLLSVAEGRCYGDAPRAVLASLYAPVRASSTDPPTLPRNETCGCGTLHPLPDTAPPPIQPGRGEGRMQRCIGEAAAQIDRHGIAGSYSTPIVITAPPRLELRAFLR